MLPCLAARALSFHGITTAAATDAAAATTMSGGECHRGAHILVTTPQYLRPISERGHVPLGNARVVVVDEADACLAGEDGGA